MNRKFFPINTAVSLLICINVITQSLFAQVLSETKNGWIVDETIKAFQNGKEAGRYGDTNFPLISVQWFPMRGVVQHTRVRRDGVVDNGSFSEMGAKGWGLCNLSESNLFSLKRLINELPPSDSKLIPVFRQILVQGATGNTNFSMVYDRSDIPFGLESILELSCGEVDWVVPSLKSFTNSVGQGRDGWLDNFAVAANTPIAASTSPEGGEIWNLTSWQAAKISGWRAGSGWQLVGQNENQVPTTNYVNGAGGSPVALSPDGNIVVIAGWNTVFALDLPNMILRWIKRKPGEYERQQWCTHLAVIDGGKSLVVALSDRMEKWSLLTGKEEMLLSTNTVPFKCVLKSSRNGTLAADLGNGVILVWESDQSTPRTVNQFSRARLMEISPNGRYLALNTDGRRLIIYDLKNNIQQEMPFRGCFNHEAWKAAWSPDGKFLVVAASGIWSCVYDTTTWKPIVLCQIGDAQYWSGGDCPFLAFENDGTLLVRHLQSQLHAFKLSSLTNEYEMPSGW